MREINRWRLRELVDNRIFDLYRFVVLNGNTELRLSKVQARRLAVSELLRAGYTRGQIADALDVNQSYVRSVEKSGVKFTKHFRTAMRVFGNPMELLKRSSTYDSEYVIYKEAVETLMIEDLVLAGWTTTQIYRATGFGIRRIQRTRKRVTEQEDD